MRPLEHFDAFDILDRRRLVGIVLNVVDIEANALCVAERADPPDHAFGSWLPRSAALSLNSIPPAELEATLLVHPRKPGAEIDELSR